MLEKVYSHVAFDLIQKFDRGGKEVNHGNHNKRCHHGCECFFLCLFFSDLVVFHGPSSSIFSTQHHEVIPGEKQIDRESQVDGVLTAFRLRNQRPPELGQLLLCQCAFYLWIDPTQGEIGINFGRFAGFVFHNG